MTDLRKILVIEDENDIRIVIESSFKGVDDLEILSAQDGEKGLGMLNTAVPDLVLLDIMMPVLDGFAVHKKMREKEPLKKVPIIFITSKDRATVDSYMKQMNDPYLLGAIFKPFDIAIFPKQVFDIWKKFLERQS